MGVGWGYGANMLTKYLVEVGESTPLTAAVCIDNPFDLHEATRSFPHHIALDQKLMAGLVDILHANKVGCDPTAAPPHTHPHTHTHPEKNAPFLPCAFMSAQSPQRWACEYINPPNKWKVIVESSPTGLISPFSLKRPSM